MEHHARQQEDGTISFFDVPFCWMPTLVSNQMVYNVKVHTVSGDAMLSLLRPLCGSLLVKSGLLICLVGFLIRPLDS